jgi:hypothetical protein
MDWAAVILKFRLAAKPHGVAQLPVRQAAENDYLVRLYDPSCATSVIGKK